jgi:hypothetical protein
MAVCASLPGKRRRPKVRSTAASVRRCAGDMRVGACQLEGFMGASLESQTSK